MQISKLIFLSILSLSLQIGEVSADYIEPSKVKIQTEHYPPVIQALPLGYYKYSVSWQGIPVTEAKIRVKQFPSKKEGKTLLYVSAEVQTENPVKAFYDLKHKNESMFYLDSYLPIKFVSDKRENSKHRVKEISFSEDRKIVNRNWKNGALQEKKSWKSENGTLDPITAVVLAKSVGLKIGGMTSFDVWNGKHRYLISFRVLSKEKITVNGVEKTAFKLRPAIKKLTDSEGEKKFKYAYIWISDDERRDILQMTSEVWIGEVKAVLERTDEKGDLTKLRPSPFFKKIITDY